MSLPEVEGLSSSDVIESTMIPPMISLIFYGGYIVLYGICIHVIVKQRRTNYIINDIIITILFNVVTGGLVSIMVNCFLQAKCDLAQSPIHECQVLDHSELEGTMFTTQVTIVIANIITDGILIWRCYLIWNQKWSIIAPLIFICVANNGALSVGFFFVPSAIVVVSHTQITMEGIFFISFVMGGILTNVSLTLLIAGRIIYISHGIKNFSTSSAQKMYQTIISATLESGLLYPFILVLYGSVTISHHLSKDAQTERQLFVAAGVLYSVLLPVMGIASTLIIVRIMLGIAVEDKKSIRDTALVEIGEQSV
ncbi:hypothetical protein E1B28_002901 [Marasmius oreades]|uniref:Uncharacterized protein n=1 Tax=Marasmius oreades TaxID=181124 RepID=A0A9P7RKD1_9AGAR|nr:uncharacterized protein E1B28_002901 [Marasmius oreades]KAG7085335.1 hypothetical protein E1B28_002901 [Marasmius oreades]